MYHSTAPVYADHGFPNPGYTNPTLTNPGATSPSFPNPMGREVNEQQLLADITVLNRDNGIEFTDPSRLERIAEKLKGTTYMKLNTSGLFHLYGKQKLDKLTGRVVVISSHVDCEKNIRKCFFQDKHDGTLLGTFDNSITNAAVLTLMLRNALPFNVLVGFTGDAEEDGIGALQLARFLENHHINFSVVVLHPTGECWREADFTIENDRWDDGIGNMVISMAESFTGRWRFVPADSSKIPDFITKDSARRNYVLGKDAEADETDSYDDKDIKCFSLCIPVFGNMHSDEGVTATVSSYLPIYKHLRLLQKC